MLQQTPEYKRLPLHRIHSRRLSAKDFDYSAPDSASHASNTFTKTQPPNVTLATPPVHSDMHYDGSHSHQAPCRDKPVELATTLWPPETTNYWFPNWKELFHGFLVVQKGQTRQAFVADSAQRGGIVCSQHQTSGSPSQCSSSQSVHYNANTSIHPIPMSQRSQQHHLQGYTKDTTPAPPLPIPIPSHDDVHSPAKQQEKHPTQVGETNKACSSPIQAPAIITKCSIKSPLWLPQGWITEIHTRRTGSTAGTRDKYFKHLASGRRFRSRKDVLHFTSTGKGRARKQNRGKKALMYSASHSLLKTFAHKKLSILEGLKPSSQRCSENKQSTHVVNTLLLGISEPGLHDDLGFPCKKLKSCSSSSIQPLGKDSAKEKSHKLPVEEKTEVLPSDIGEDKRASKIWQWLTKPVARYNGTHLNQELLTVSFSKQDVEKAMTQMTDERSIKELSLRDQTAHKAIQLSKEIQAAHDNVIQMSREMQATAEKLSKEILVARKDVELGHETSVQQLPTQTFVMLAANPETSKGCKPKIETLSRSPVTNSTQDQTSKLGAATNNLLNPAQLSNFANSIICEIPGPDHASGISKEGQILLQAVTSMPETCSSFPLPVNQPTTWSTIIMHPAVQMLKTVHAPTETETQAAKRHGDAFNHAIEPERTALVGAFQKNVVPAVFTPHQTEKSPVTKGDVTQPALRAEVPMIHTQNSLQMACASSGSGIKATDGCVSAYQEVKQLSDHISHSTCMTRNHITVTNNLLKQPVNDAQAARRQTRSMDHLAQIPVMLKEQVTPSPGICADATAKCNAVYTEKPGILSYGAQLSGAYSALGIGTQETSDSKQIVKWQQIDEIEARRLRRKKFSAVLNPKLDLSRLSPSLTTRQRAKVVEKMKARHARELLATLGKHICRKAVRRKP